MTSAVGGERRGGGGATLLWYEGDALAAPTGTCSRAGPIG
jgi:hypothetical protein